MNESQVITRIKKWSRENDFIFRKTKGATHNRAFPDIQLIGKCENIAKPTNQERLLLLSLPIVIFLETKATGKQLTESQAIKLNDLRSNGQYAIWADSIEMFYWWLSEIQKHLTGQGLDSDVVWNLFGDVRKAKHGHRDVFSNR